MSLSRGRGKAATPYGASGLIYTPTAVVTRKYLQFVLGL